MKTSDTIISYKCSIAVHNALHCNDIWSNGENGIDNFFTYVGVHIQMKKTAFRQDIIINFTVQHWEPIVIQHVQ